MTTLEKDPDAVLDFTVNWSDWLEPGETILAADIGVKQSLILNPEGRPTTIRPDSVSFWLGGGAPFTVYQVGCRITTDQGRIEERSFDLLVIER